MRHHAEAEEHGAVCERRVAHVLAARGEHGGEARGHQQRDRQQPEQLARAGGHPPPVPGSRFPRSSARTRSVASSLLRQEWSSTTLRRAAGIARAGTPLAYSCS